MGRRTDETGRPVSETHPVPSPVDEATPELAQGSEVHDVEALAREAAVDRMLLAYLHDRELPPRRPTVELVLYVVSKSESCDKAMRSLQRALSQYDKGDVTVVVRDLAEGPRTAEDHKIVIVPTIMMKHPRMVFLPGDLPDDAAVLHDLLRSCGVKRSSSSRR